MLRAQICRNLTYLGVELDPERNQVSGREAEISAPGSRVRVFVIPTDEERVIARDTVAVLRQRAAS